MKPYYETELGRLYHGDCLEIMPHLEPVDLVLTDPPYGVGFNYKQYDDTKKNHAMKIGQWFEAFKKKSNIVAVSCGIVNIWKWPQADWVLCWHKPFSVGHSPFGANNWEPVLVYIDKGRRCERQSDYFNATFIKNNNKHPCPKPIAWAFEGLRILSKINEIILDPFLGSGTTAVACERLNRRWIGVEISEKYCEIAVKRIENERKQLKLF